ncbi:hypothetical protein D3C81_1951560 [compost metagenome]
MQAPQQPQQAENDQRHAHDVHPFIDVIAVAFAILSQQGVDGAHGRSRGQEGCAGILHRRVAG